MKLTFVSNYLNHHQIPVSNRLYEKLGAKYHFIQTEQMEEERVQMGWQPDTQNTPFLMFYYEDSQACQRLIDESDVVVFGGTDDESFIQNRLRQGKIVLRYSERIYKTGRWKAVSPRGLKQKYHDHIRYRKSQVYLLCSGAYVASDFHLIGAYPHKMFKWGYFPETRIHDVDKLIKQKDWTKENKVATLLWAGRFIDWKHPEMPILLAEKLQKEQISFRLRMIGGGVMSQEIQQMIKDKGLQEHVEMLGFRTPAEVREEMEKSQIFLFTSDYQEGWGAVLNEAMNSGCAVVANEAIGAVPFLLRSGENGMTYRNRHFEELYQKTLTLIKDADEAEKMGRNAYQTIIKDWNAELAADRLLELAGNISVNKTPVFWASGICSRAELL